MTVQQAIDIFAILYDKYGSANLVDSEVVELLNMALTGEYMNRLFPDSQGGVVNYETDQNIVANIQPLIWTLMLNMNGSGVLTDAVINAALVSATHAGATYFRIGSIGWTTDGATIPVKYVRQNDRWSSERNVFKKPSTSNPKFTLIGSGLQFYPTSASTNLTVNVVKKPKLLDDGDLSATCELGDYQLYTVISLALKLAGISTTSTEVLEDIRLAGLQISQ